MIREYQARFKVKDAPEHQAWSSWAGVNKNTLKDIKDFDLCKHFNYQFRTIYIQDGIAEDEDIVPWELPKGEFKFPKAVDFLSDEQKGRSAYIIHVADIPWKPTWAELPLAERQFWIKEAKK